METLEEKIRRVTKEKVAIEPYNPMWPLMFEDEKEHLLSNLPNDLIKRIEHFGSTAVPGLSAKPPFYAWFIKRDSKGNRTHHIHMVEKDFELWDRLYFRNYLIENPKIAAEYQELKLHLSEECNSDRVEYTKRKTEFIQRITQLVKNHYEQA